MSSKHAPPLTGTRVQLTVEASVNVLAYAAFDAVTKADASELSVSIADILGFAEDGAREKVGQVAFPRRYVERLIEASRRAHALLLAGREERACNRDVLAEVETQLLAALKPFKGVQSDV